MHADSEWTSRAALNRTVARTRLVVDSMIQEIKAASVFGEKAQDCSAIWNHGGVGFTSIMVQLHGMTGVNRALWWT
jgi:hypothetical protein